MPRLPPPTTQRRAFAWRAVLLTAAIVLFGLAAMTRSWALLALALAPALAAWMLDPSLSNGRGGI